MVEFEPIQLMQVNATIIAGILILLTITKTRTFFPKDKAKELPRWVAFIVIPFSFSSIMLLIASVLNPETELIDDLHYWATVTMIAGFVYIIIAMLPFAKSEKTS